MKKKITAIIVAAVLVFCQINAFAFDDVKNHWAKDVIEKMSSLKIINGYSDDKFGPEDQVRRVDSLLLVSRILGASDDSLSQYVDAGYSKYFANVNVLGYQSYEKTLSFLLYRGVYQPTELKEFLYNKQGDTALKRYEAAIILVKLMGAEKTVEQNTMPMLSFDDSAKIPADAKAYVEYCVENSLMKGMGNNEFSPLTSVTRAQMATMLNTVREKLNLTYSQGTVTEVNAITDTVKYQDSNGNEKTISLIGDVPVKADGEDVTSSAKIKNGMKVSVAYRDGKLYFIEFVSVVSDDTYSGVYVSSTISSSERKIKFSRTGATTEIQEVTLADDCVITYEGSAASLESIKKDSYVTVTVANSKATRLEFKNSSTTVTGTVSEITYSSPALMTIKKNDSSVETYELASSVSVKKNNKEMSPADITTGDKVTLIIKYNKITEITATSSSKTVKGKISEILISNNPKIKIETSSGVVECNVNALNEDYIKINGKKCNIYDLKLGYEATVTLESSTIKSIDIEQVDITDGKSSSVSGLVQAVDTNFNFLTIKLSDGTEKQIFVSDSTYIVDSSTTKVKKLSAIKAGDTITATVSSTNNSTLIAITIVIM